MCVNAAKAEKIVSIAYDKNLSVKNNGQSAAKPEMEGSTSII